VCACVCVCGRYVLGVGKFAQSVSV
jgi:hypothetical protein